MRGQSRTCVLLVVLCLAGRTAWAQNWSFDARKVGLGSPGSTENVASKMIEEERRYRSIVLPFGLLQVLRDFDKLDPTNDGSDLVRTIEYAASPLHYTVGRDGTNTGQQLVVDVRNATLNRDLNTYKGFVPAHQPRAEGLASPNWGGTVKVHRGSRGAFQGIYIGAGPYLSMRDDVSIDQQLIDILGSAANVYLPNTQIRLGNRSEGQLALAITGGYRGRFSYGDTASDRDGVYVAANLNYLRGFRYEDVDMALRLDTDGAGLLTVNPFLPSPLVVARHSAESGTGAAVDVGLGVVAGKWEAGFGVSGIANRIEWRGVERTTYALGNVFLGDSEFVESVPLPIGDVRVELPVDYSGNVSYATGRWMTVAEVGHGYQGTSFRAGAEYVLGGVELRGGGSYTRERWNPAVGVGLPIGGRVAVDVALYSNSANIERTRRPAIAVSLRLNR